MAEAKNKKKTTSTSAKKTTSKTSTKKATNTKSTAKTTPVVEKEVKEEVKVVETKKEEKKSFMDVMKENATLIFLCAICILLIVNIILIVVGHKVELSNGAEVIASVDGKKITADELFESIKENYGTNELVNMIDEFIVSKEIADTKDATEQAKDQVANIKSQYEAMDYKWDEVLENYGYASEQVLIDEIKNSILKEDVVINYLSKRLTDEEIKKYYDEEIEDSYSAKHILIKSEATSSMSDEEIAAKDEEAKNKAQNIINELNNGADWATLVTTYTEDSGSKDNEGLYENFTKGDLFDEFFNAVKSLEDGKYTTEPVKSKYGYHIILRISKTNKEALDTMKDELVEEIVNKKLSSDNNLYNNAWAEIRDSYNLKINDTTIESYYNKKLKGE